ncbi:MAG: hypothetical protein ACRCXL_05945 [Dermatophilaceae bacterium]
MNDLGTGAVPVLLALGFGGLSALVPVLNAEAFLLASAAVAPTTAVQFALVAALGVGQTAGKVVLFLAARRGRELRAGRPRRPRRQRGRLQQRLGILGARALALLDRPAPAAGVLVASASVGIPPLAVTSVAAGTRTTPLWLFVGCTLVGRVARFAALATPVVLAR